MTCSHAVCLGGMELQDVTAQRYCAGAKASALEDVDTGLSQEKAASNLK